MKTMKKLWMAVTCTAAFVLASCQEESFEGRPDQDNYYASVETFGTDTRTALGEGRSVVWSSEDRIAIFEGNGAGQAYQVLNAYVGKSSGEFAEVEGLVAEGTGAGIEGTIAVYPFNEDLSVTSGDNGNYIIEGITFPSEQKYIAGSFSDEAFPMTAICENGNKSLSFKNIGGALKLSLTGSYSVSQITLTGNSGEPLSSPATVTLGSDGIPSVTMSDDASTSVSLICDPAVQLDPETATDFYISIPPTDFEAGFKVTILDGEGKEHGLATHKTNLAERSSILSMPESTPESLDDIELTADTFCSVDFVEGWTETRFGGDGTIVFIKEDDMGRKTHSLMFLPNEETVLMPVYVRFDEKEVPSYMSFMDTEIYVDGYTQNTIDFTLAVEEAVWSIKDVPFDELKFFSPATKAWADNNWVRNVCAIGNLVVGSLDVVGGALLIAGSGIAETVSGGASTPISVPGIVAGGVNIAGGCLTIAEGFNTIWGPAEQAQTPYAEQVIRDAGLTFVAEFFEFLDRNPDYKFSKKFPKDLVQDAIKNGKPGLLSFSIGMGLTTIDELWGETYGRYRTIAQAHEDINVVTGGADNITSTSAELHGYVSPLATRPLGEKIHSSISILVWGSIITDRHIINSDGGEVSFVFDNLIPERTYKYQIMFHDVTNDIIRYGEEKEFKTKGDEGERWVDLGLSVLWAAYNVGASSPEEYGGYYAWGETSTKSDYTWENYIYREKYYCGNGPEDWYWVGKFIGNEISGTSYDVAHVQWGGGARMPTLAEVQELVDNCTFTAGSYNGVRGNYVTGPNGNSIFLPFAGCRYCGVLSGEGGYGFFWSGTYYYYDNGGFGAYFLFCGGDDGDWSSVDRGNGHSVRPVTEK